MKKLTLKRFFELWVMVTTSVLTLLVMLWLIQKFGIGWLW